jgi:hypothetical protein
VGNGVSKDMNGDVVLIVLSIYFLGTNKDIIYRAEASNLRSPKYPKFVSKKRGKYDFVEVKDDYVPAIYKKMYEILLELLNKDKVFIR